MTDGYIVRRMTLEDVDAVFAIEQATFPMPWTREDFEREMTVNVCARYIVAVEGDTVIAYAGAWMVLDEGHITNVAVRADRRGRGVGESVMRALMQYAGNLGVGYMTLEVRAGNAPAISLYKKLGFQKVGVRKKYYIDNGEDAWIMAAADIPAAQPDFTEPETEYTE